MPSKYGFKTQAERDAEARALAEKQAREMAPEEARRLALNQKRWALEAQYQPLFDDIEHDYQNVMDRHGGATLHANDDGSLTVGSRYDDMSASIAEALHKQTGRTVHATQDVLVSASREGRESWATHPVKTFEKK